MDMQEIGNSQYMRIYIYILHHIRHISYNITTSKNISPGPARAFTGLECAKPQPARRRPGRTEEIPGKVMKFNGYVPWKARKCWFKYGLMGLERFMI